MIDQLISSDEEFWLIKRELWVVFCEMLASRLIGIQGQNWRHPGVKLFLKEVFFKKDMIFNSLQKELLSNCMEKILKIETSNKTELKKLENRDSNI